MIDNQDTVEVLTRLRKTRRLKMGYNKSQTDGSKVAAIRVSGIYLHDLGFDPDGFFDMVINSDGSLTMRPVSSDEVATDKAATAAARGAMT